MGPDVEHYGDAEQTAQTRRVGVNAVVMPRIVQLLMTPNNNTWHGALLGLGSDGVTYKIDANGRWSPMIPPIKAV